MNGLAAASARDGRAPAAPPDDLTKVELVWIEKQIEHWSPPWRSPSSIQARTLLSSPAST